jgi:hypothetical protein
METSAPGGPGMADTSNDGEPEAGDSEPATYGNASPISVTSSITFSGAVAKEKEPSREGSRSLNDRQHVARKGKQPGPDPGAASCISLRKI